MPAADLIIKSGNVVTFRGVRWWAYDGLIRSENVDGSRQETHYVRDILLRLNALNQMVGNSRTDLGITRYATEVREYRQYIEDMLALCRQAQTQGRPDHAASRKQRIADFKASHSRRIVVPSLGF